MFTVVRGRTILLTLAVAGAGIWMAMANAGVTVQNYAAPPPVSKAASVPAATDQGQFHSPEKLVENEPMGSLRNPYAPTDKKIVKEGHQLFVNHGCSGCHGGNGGGGMCPSLAAGNVWSYGSNPDTLYRLVTLGSKKLKAKYHLTRNSLQSVKGNMPAMGPAFANHPEQIWKILTWVESMHLQNGKETMDVPGKS